MTEEKVSLKRTRRIIFEWRFIYLFSFILLLISLKPVQKKLDFFDILLDIIMTAVLLAAINAVSQNKKQAVFGIILAVPAFVTTWSTTFFDHPSIDLASAISGVAFFLFLAVAIFNFVIKQDQITRDLMTGAAVVYLLFAITWAFAYEGIELLQPGSFYISEQDSLEQGFPYMYFSIVTITTLGYGDIHPISAVSRTAASLEALIGQIYLVFTVARLVGIHTTQSMEKKKKNFGETGKKDGVTR